MVKVCIFTRRVVLLQLIIKFRPKQGFSKNTVPRPLSIVNFHLKHTVP